MHMTLVQVAGDTCPAQAGGGLSPAPLEQVAGDTCPSRVFRYVDTKHCSPASQHTVCKKVTSPARVCFGFVILRQLTCNKYDPPQ